MTFSYLCDVMNHDDVRFESHGAKFNASCSYTNSKHVLYFSKISSSLNDCGQFMFNLCIAQNLKST